MGFPSVDLTLNQYAEQASQTAIYPGAGTVEGLPYAGLGIAEEAGEVSGKIKKMLRDDGGRLTNERQAAIEKELGDVLWYIAAVARDAGLNLEDVALANLAKLRDRAARGVLGGSGDDR